MTTDCTTTRIRMQGPGGRELVGGFDGGYISSDGGATLLEEVERRTGIIAQLAACFTDHRRPEQVEHTIAQMLAQRIFGLALGYDPSASPSACFNGAAPLGARRRFPVRR